MSRAFYDVIRILCNTLNFKKGGGVSCLKRNFYSRYYYHDNPIFFAISDIRGVDSFHHNFFEDRRWRFLCERISGATLSDCRFEVNYINNWDAPVNYNTGSRILSGKSFFEVNIYRL